MFLFHTTGWDDDVSGANVLVEYFSILIYIENDGP
jgi:hypothetical protein